MQQLASQPVRSACNVRAHTGWLLTRKHSITAQPQSSYIALGLLRRWRGGGGWRRRSSTRRCCTENIPACHWRSPRRWGVGIVWELGLGWGSATRSVFPPAQTSVACARGMRWQYSACGESIAVCVWGPSMSWNVMRVDVLRGRNITTAPLFRSSLPPSPPTHPL